MKSKTNRRKASTKPAAEKRDIYAELTEKFVRAVMEDKNPFKMAFQRLGGFAANAVTGQTYNGINQLMLGLGNCEYETPLYLTYQQAQEHGGHVRKGEKGSLVVFWKMLESRTETDSKGRPKTIPYLKYYTVFNVAQCDGLEGLKLPTMPRFENGTVEDAERVIAEMPNAPRISTVEGFARAYYSPSLDLIKMPDRSQFVDAESFYHVLFHELSHATGHKSRLGRLDITKDGASLAAFGSEEYSREELVAEMSASFCSARLGIFSEETEKMTVAYLRSWLRPLQNDPKAIAHAAGKAMKACQWIFGEIRTAEETDSETAALVAA
jgi:antirestriction protein ArdC